MTDRMLRAFPAVQRRDDTDDIWQAAAIRFYWALNETAPESVAHFRHLAGLQTISERNS